jgi:4-hydroxybenzoate polyprenyltransferase/phosphoserine phosphatase
MLKTVQDAVATRALCVDLDGTLVRSDLLIEAAFELIRRNALYLFLLPFWLARGKAHLKQQIADRVDIDAAILPYHESLLDHLRTERAAGRHIVLATASNEKYAHAVAEHLELFDAVYASDADINLCGERKLEHLRGEFGTGNFDYAGNAMADIPIWREAGEAVIVNPEPGVGKAAKAVAQASRSFDDRSRGIRPYVRAMRLHQWLKNTLVFVPLALAHQLADTQLLLQAGIAFLAFGLCASSVYILNDLFDLQSDRRHQRKRHRPFAAGRIPIVHGIIMIPILLSGAMGLTALLPWQFSLILGAYYLATLAYSLFLKRAVLVDVLALAGLFTSRVIAGGAAVTIPVSFWLLAFSMFIFLSLALVKRYVELTTLVGSSGTQTEGRGYRDVDLETLAHFGTASGYMSVLVLALYVNSTAVTLRYTHPEAVWFLCPIVLFLISRIWLLARRDELHDDPIVFAIKDRRSQVAVALGAVLLWAAAL